MERKVKLDDITLDERVYPRFNWNVENTRRYAQAMRGGAVFPPIVVATVEGELVLIDGKHRLEAQKINEVKETNAIDLGVMPLKDALIESTRLNAAHGTALDRNYAIEKLVDAGISLEIISGLFSIPKNELELYSPKKLVTPFNPNKDAARETFEALKEKVSEKTSLPETAFPRSPTHFMPSHVMLSPYDNIVCPNCKQVCKVYELKKNDVAH